LKGAIDAPAAAKVEDPTPVTVDDGATGPSSVLAAPTPPVDDPLESFVTSIDRDNLGVGADASPEPSQPAETRPAAAPEQPSVKTDAKAE
jgi:hypothetical protein